MRLRERPRLLWGAALLMPLLVFAGLWASTHIGAQQGQDWLIPVKGYDPRDLLRGHYVRYRYDWPIAAPDPDAAVAFEPADQSALCIHGVAPIIDRVSGVTAPGGCAAIARATLGARQEVRGLDSGILFVSQARVSELNDKLSRDKLQALVRVRIRPDGVMRPIGLEFRPRP